jgi:hypothetical protein
MKPATGQVLRGVGLAIEAVCLAAFLAIGDTGWAGTDVRLALKLGVALGVALWVAGWAIIRTTSRLTRDQGEKEDREQRVDECT